ncbi:MAG TPA: cytidine deaminase [Candidatus Eisenbacteria bacterium]
MNPGSHLPDVELLARVEALLDRAYGRYSSIRVAAVVMLEDGTLHDGVNVENSSLGLTVCAERNALFGAVADGAAVGTHAPGPRPVRIVFTSNSDDVTVPCGACRQVIRELAPHAEIVFGRNGTIRKRWASIDELLPFAFDGDWDSRRPGSA